MEDQHDLPSLSNTLLRLMLWPMIDCLLVLDRVWDVIDEVLNGTLEADQSYGASQADSLGTTVDASGKDSPVPLIQVVAVPV